MAKSTARSRDFGTTKTVDDFEPLDFKLNGETFVCRPAIQGGTLLAFVADADSDQGGRAAGALYNFFQSAMEPEEYARFKDSIEGDKHIVDMSVLGDIASWLVEEYTARPTTASSPSGSGRSSSGTSSTADAS